jgi:hypothetical protein
MLAAKAANRMADQSVPLCRERDAYACMYVCMYLICICIYIYVCMCVCMYVCMYSICVCAIIACAVSPTAGLIRGRATLELAYYYFDFVLRLSYCRL